MNQQNKNEKAKSNQNTNKVVIRCTFEEAEKFKELLVLYLKCAKTENTLLELKGSDSFFVLQPIMHYNITNEDIIVNFISDFDYLTYYDDKGTIAIQIKQDDEQIVINYDLEKNYFELELEMLANLLLRIAELSMKESEYKIGFLQYHLKSDEAHHFLISSSSRSYSTKELFEKDFVNLDEKAHKIVYSCNLYQNYNKITSITLELEKPEKEDFFDERTLNISFNLEVVK